MFHNPPLTYMTLFFRELVLMRNKDNQAHALFYMIRTSALNCKSQSVANSTAASVNVIYSTCWSKLYPMVLASGNMVYNSTSGNQPLPNLWDCEVDCDYKLNHNVEAEVSMHRPQILTKATFDNCFAPCCWSHRG